MGLCLGARLEFGAGSRKGGGSGSGCTPWRCALALLAAAGATYGSLWVSITQGLKTPATEVRRGSCPVPELVESLALSKPTRGVH